MQQESWKISHIKRQKVRLGYCICIKKYVNGCFKNKINVWLSVYGDAVGGRTKFGKDSIPLAAGRLQQSNCYADTLRSRTDVTVKGKHDKTQESDMEIVRRISELAKRKDASV